MSKRQGSSGGADFDPTKWVELATQGLDSGPVRIEDTADVRTKPAPPKRETGPKPVKTLAGQVALDEPPAADWPDDWPTDEPGDEAFDDGRIPDDPEGGAWKDTGRPVVLQLVTGIPPQGGNVEVLPLAEDPTPFEELPPPGQPLDVYRKVAPRWQPGGKRVRRFWHDTWMNWSGTHWTPMDPLAMARELYLLTGDAVFKGKDKNGEDVVRPWAPNRSRIGDLEHVAKSMCVLPSTVMAPCWLENDRGPALSCRNGILLLKERKLIPHTPDYLNESSTPLDYTPTAECPRWLAFLAEVWPNDELSPALLQEWFGYVLSGRTDLQKMLLIKGLRRSGKGTIARVLKALVGDTNVSGPSMESFRTDFGLAPLIGKTLAVVPDARLGDRDTSALTERLLAISGEDTVNINRKYKAEWEGKLGTRLMMLSNELPRFKDASAAVVSRFMVLITNETFEGREDPGLTDALLGELGGILLWALAGLDRLNEQKRFTVPEPMADAVEIMEGSASPVKVFVREGCILGPNERVDADTLWAAWQQWAGDSGQAVRNREEFGRLLSAAAGGISKGRGTRDAAGKRASQYKGIGLQLDGWQCGNCRKPLTLKEMHTGPLVHPGGCAGYNSSLPHDDPNA